MMHEPDELATFEEVVEACADLFETLDSTNRIRALTFVNSLKLDKQINLTDALKTLTIVCEIVHRMIMDHIEPEEEESEQANAMRSQVGALMHIAWCGNIENTFIKPLMFALAVEIRDWE